MGTLEMPTTLERLQPKNIVPTPPAESLERVEVTHSPRGNRLRKTIVLWLPKPRSPGERGLREYVSNALSWKMHSLIPFTLYNRSVLEVAKHLKRHCTGSSATLYQYVYGIYRFCTWLQRSPNQLIESCKPEGTPSPKTLTEHLKLIDDFIGELQAQGLAPGTISNHVKGVKALYRANNINLQIPYRLPRRVKYKDRSPTPKELQKLMDIADLRERVIISTLALGGFRVGTLVKLRYRHVQRDLERGVIPIHVHVEAEITKGKYGDYDTFLGQEAVEYLKAYLHARKIGSRELRMPPEKLTPQSPLIRNAHTAAPKPITAGQVHRIIHQLYRKAGLLSNGNGRRYRLRPHSLRKYFRTQLAALGMNTDYIEYMMGHKVNTYHDVQMKGVEFLRRQYQACGLSIKPKTKVSKIDMVKAFAQGLGLNPEEILSRKALARPHRTVLSGPDREREDLRILSQAIKDLIKQEIAADSKTV